MSPLESYWVYPVQTDQMLELVLVGDRQVEVFTLLSLGFLLSVVCLWSSLCVSVPDALLALDLILSCILCFPSSGQRSFAESSIVSPLLVTTLFGFSSVCWSGFGSEFCLWRP